MIFRLTSALVAVRADSCGMRIISIPAGTSVEIVGRVDTYGLVEVRSGDRIFSMYMSDLEQGADPVSSQSA
jgi:hypothetical protein